MSSRRIDNIKVLSEQLGSLPITNETSDETTEQSNKAMSVAPVLLWDALDRNNFYFLFLLFYFLLDDEEARDITVT